MPVERVQWTSNKTGRQHKKVGITEPLELLFIMVDLVIGLLYVIGFIHVFPVYRRTDAVSIRWYSLHFWYVTVAMNLFEYSISSTSFSMQEKNENILKVRLQLVIL